MKNRKKARGDGDVRKVGLNETILDSALPNTAGQVAAGLAILDSINSLTDKVAEIFSSPPTFPWWNPFVPSIPNWVIF